MCCCAGTSERGNVGALFARGGSGLGGEEEDGRTNYQICNCKSVPKVFPLGQALVLLSTSLLMSQKKEVPLIFVPYRTRKYRHDSVVFQLCCVSSVKDLQNWEIVTDRRTQ